jgi:drug/metabolite transporter (DMT)-like permease
VIHAVWNTLLAGARDSQAFAAVVLLVGAGAGAPVAVAYWRLDDGVWPYLVATSVLELAYFALLTFAYARAELSVVYPLARGLAPVLVLVGGVAFTGAGATPRQVAGVLTVGVGILLVRGVGRGRGAVVAVTIACTIAAYTLVDKRGVVHASGSTRCRRASRIRRRASGARSARALRSRLSPTIRRSRASRRRGRRARRRA